MAINNNDREGCGSYQREEFKCPQWAIRLDSWEPQTRWYACVLQVPVGRHGRWLDTVIS